MKVVLIKKYSLGNIPTQDTYVTRSHPIYINNNFVVAESLINNTSIRWKRINDEVFYNIDCEKGNKFIANGLVVGDISVNNIDYKLNHSIITKINEFKTYLHL